MFTTTISGENSAASLYIWELALQCRIAEHAFARLQEYARVQVVRDYSNSHPHAETAVELLADCSTFLSAAGVIAKLMFSGADAGPERLRANRSLAVAAKRSAALRELLLIDQLPSLRSLGVRNAFEHVDERLDRMLQENRSDKFVWMHLGRDTPPPGLVLKRLDPHTLQLSYLDVALNLRECHTEIQMINSHLGAAHEKVRSSVTLLAAGSGL